MLRAFSGHALRLKDLWDTDSKGQPENCRQHCFRDYHSPIRFTALAVNLRFYRFGGTTQQIASHLTTISHVCLCEDLGVMALDLLSYDSDINSESTE